jgi:hypothetical protein
MVVWPDLEKNIQGQIRFDKKIHKYDIQFDIEACVRSSYVVSTYFY